MLWWGKLINIDWQLFFEEAEAQGEKGRLQEKEDVLQVSPRNIISTYAFKNAKAMPVWQVYRDGNSGTELHFQPYQRLWYAQVTWKLKSGLISKSPVRLDHGHVRDKQYEHMWVLSCGPLFETPWTAAHQAPLSMEFSRQEYWSGLPFPLPGDLPDPGIVPAYYASLALASDNLPLHQLENPMDSTRICYYTSDIVLK